MVVAFDTNSHSSSEVYVSNETPPSTPPSGSSRRDFLKGAAIAGIGATGAGALLTESALAGGNKGSGIGNLPGEANLGGNIGKSLFYTINVSDLDASVDFYEKVYPVKRAEIMNGPVQAFKGLGIRRGQFKARVMRDSQDFQGGAILLVQWLDPTPVGKPYKEANHVGWYREHASADRSGQQAWYERALAAGAKPYGPPSEIQITPTLSIYSWAMPDLDGTTLEWVGPVEPDPNGKADNLGGPNVNCRDIVRSFHFYHDILGLDFQARLNPVEPQPGTNGSLGDTIRTPKGELYTGLTDFDATILVPRTDGRNSVDLLEWQMPGAYGRPYKHANNLGAVNLTWEVNDIDVVYKKLSALLRKARNIGEARIVHPPETWDLGDYGTRKVLNILDPDGVMLQFQEKPQSGAEVPAYPKKPKPGKGHGRDKDHGRGKGNGKHNGRDKGNGRGRGH